MVNEVVSHKRRGGQAGRVELISACRRMAIEHGTTLEKELWLAMHGLLKAAATGNTKAAAMALRFLVWHDTGEPGAPVPKVNNPGGIGGLGSGVTVNLGAGPPVPDDVTAYLHELDAAAQSLEPRITITPYNAQAELPDAMLEDLLS